MVPNRKPKGSAKDAKGKGTGGQFASKPVASQPDVTNLEVIDGVRPWITYYDSPDSPTPHSKTEEELALEVGKKSALHSFREGIKGELEWMLFDDMNESRGERKFDAKERLLVIKNIKKQAQYEIMCMQECTEDYRARSVAPTMGLSVVPRWVPPSSEIDDQVSAMFKVDAYDGHATIIQSRARTSLPAELYALSPELQEQAINIAYSFEKTAYLVQLMMHANSIAQIEGERMAELAHEAVYQDCAAQRKDSGVMRKDYQLANEELDSVIIESRQQWQDDRDWDVYELTQQGITPREVEYPKQGILCADYRSEAGNIVEEEARSHLYDHSNIEGLASFNRVSFQEASESQSFDGCTPLESAEILYNKASKLRDRIAEAIEDHWVDMSGRMSQHQNANGSEPPVSHIAINDERLSSRLAILDMFPSHRYGGVISPQYHSDNIYRELKTLSNGSPGDLRKRLDKSRAKHETLHDSLTEFLSDR